jgi:hypothetical protein
MDEDTWSIGADGMAGWYTMTNEAAAQQQAIDEMAVRMQAAAEALVTMRGGWSETTTCPCTPPMFNP